MILDGLRVVSLAQQYPGPYCTLLLADLGADVLLVERPQGGDPARGVGSVEGMSPFFAALNRNKRSIALDLHQEEGRAILWQLLHDADALVEGFRPGVMERLGFGPDEVRSRLPGLVYVSISGYGQDGPDRLVPGHDLSYAARAGLLANADDPTRYHLPLAIADLSSGTFAALAIVAGIAHRARTGNGVYIDLSMTEGLVSWMGTTLEPVLNGREDRRGSREPAYGTFRCADGSYLTLSIAFEDHFWRALCTALDMAEHADLPSARRRARADELRQLIASRLAARPRDEWITTLQAADVPCGPVASLDEVVDDPQFRAREMFLDGPSESGGRRWHVGSPFRVEGRRPAIRMPAPRLGEHTEETLAALGYDAGAIERLRDAGVIGP